MFDQVIYGLGALTFMAIIATVLAVLGAVAVHSWQALVVTVRLICAARFKTGTQWWVKIIDSFHAYGLVWSRGSGSEYEIPRTGERICWPGKAQDGA